MIGASALRVELIPRALRRSNQSSCNGPLLDFRRTPTLSLSAAAVPAAHSMIHLGLDVRKESITIAVLPAEAKASTRLDQLPTTPTIRRSSRSGRTGSHATARSTHATRRAARWTRPPLCAARLGHACDVIAPALILLHRAMFPIATMCRALGVSRSWYYAWVRRPVSSHATRDVALTAQVTASHAWSDGTYDAPPFWNDRRNGGERVGRKGPGGRVLAPLTGEFNTRFRRRCARQESLLR